VGGQDLFFVFVADRKVESFFAIWVIVCLSRRTLLHGIG